MTPADRTGAIREPAAGGGATPRPFRDRSEASPSCGRESKFLSLILVSYGPTSGWDKVCNGEKQYPASRWLHSRWESPLGHGSWSVERGRILSLIHIPSPTRLGMISYAVFC